MKIFDFQPLSPGVLGQNKILEGKMASEIYEKFQSHFGAKKKSQIKSKDKYCTQQKNLYGQLNLVFMVLYPNYRAQNFTNNDSVHLELTDDLISFRYESDYNLSVDVLYRFPKKTIPDNCASQQEIDGVVNSINSQLKVQIKTSQYSVKQKSFQTAFRYLKIYTLSNQYIQGTLKVQQQTTTVKEDLLFKSEKAQISPLQYDFEVQTLDRQSAISLMNLSCYCQSGIILDQLYQQVQIYYPTIPAILALTNSIFSILMLLGFIYDKNQCKLQQPIIKQEQILDKTSESEDRSVQQENQSVIDKSNCLSPIIYYQQKC
ncbi:hypothetical protein ABPG72_021412 [Tetrahymena utriculariae]